MFSSSKFGKIHIGERKAPLDCGGSELTDSWRGQDNVWLGALSTHTMNQTDRIEAVDLKVPVRRAKPRAGFLSASDSVVFAGNKDDLRKVWPHFEIK